MNRRRGAANLHQIAFGHGLAPFALQFETLAVERQIDWVARPTDPGCASHSCGEIVQNPLFAVPPSLMTVMQ